MLDGIRVISLTHYLQGPSCVQYLADLGADVIKVEKIGGAYERSWSGSESWVGDQSVFFLLAGRNQRSIEIDLRSPEGIEVLWKLIETADVLVENFRPGALARLGLDYEAVKSRNPSIVYCSLSGYGSAGPLSGKAGQDLLIQSISGLAMLTGGQDSPPTPVGSAVVDQHGATLGALGILAALVRRGSTGQGAHVDANLLSAALDLQIEPLNYYLNGSDLYPRSSGSLATRFHQAPYGVYKTQDNWITVSLSAADLLAEVLPAPELSGLTRDDQFTQRERVSAIVADALLARTTAQWLAIFDAAGVWAVPVRDYAELVDDEQVAANGSILSIEHPTVGNVRLLAHPVKYDGVVPSVTRAPPLSGQHTRELLSEIGYSPAEIAAHLAARHVAISSDTTP